MPKFFFSGCNVKYLLQPTFGAKCLSLNKFYVNIPCRIEAPEHSARRIIINWYFRDSNNVHHMINPFSSFFQPFMVVYGVAIVTGHLRIINSNLTMKGMEAMRHAILNEGSYYCRPADTNGTEMFSASKSLSLNSLMENAKFCLDNSVVIDEDKACAGNIFEFVASKDKIMKKEETAVATTTNSSMVSSQISITVSPTAAIKTNAIKTQETLLVSSKASVASSRIQFEFVEARKKLDKKPKGNSKPWIFLLGTIASMGLVIIVLVFIIGAAMIKKKKARKLH